MYLYCQREKVELYVIDLKVIGSQLKLWILILKIQDFPQLKQKLCFSHKFENFHRIVELYEVGTSNVIYLVPLIF